MSVRSIPVKASVRVAHGRLLTPRNLARIHARSVTPLGSSVITTKVDTNTYCAVYDLQRDERGFIFRERLFGYGIDGHHRTVRAAVIGALRFSHIRVEVDAS